MNYFPRIVLSSFMLFFSILSVGAQEICFLGIGSERANTIEEVFELTESQKENLKNWGAELLYRNELFELKAEGLLKNNAQASMEDLLTISYKYKTLLDSMQANLYRIDKRMLTTFSPEQYATYLNLCRQITRSPIFVAVLVDEK